jgi:hypothetical protein
MCQRLQYIINSDHDNEVQRYKNGRVVMLQRVQAEFLPDLAARLSDPAGNHRLVAVQDALMEFYK